MLKKVFFFLFAALTVLCLVMTVLLIIAAAQEYHRVSQQLSPSGVDYLAANLLKGEATLAGVAAVVNGCIAACFGFMADWKKK